MSSKKHAIELMNFAHGMVEKAAAGIPSDKVCFQASPTGNHLLWTLGHLSTTYAWLATMIDAKANANLPDSFNGLFGSGSKPVPDASKFPPFAEVRRHYENAWKLFLGLVEKLPESELWSACASDSMGFASSKIDSAYKCAWHDGWHLGQLAEVRKALKLPGLF